MAVKQKNQQQKKTDKGPSFSNLGDTISTDQKSNHFFYGEPTGSEGLGDSSPNFRLSSLRRK